VLSGVKEDVDASLSFSLLARPLSSFDLKHMNAIHVLFLASASVFFTFPR
jgi:hypothetical protein